MVIVEMPRVQTLIGCHTSDIRCGSHLLATHRITEVCVLTRSFATLQAAHGLLALLTIIFFIMWYNQATLAHVLKYAMIGHGGLKVCTYAFMSSIPPHPTPQCLPMPMQLIRQLRMGVGRHLFE